MTGRNLWNEFRISLVAFGVLWMASAISVYAAAPEVLQYRLAKAKTLHLNDEATAKSYVKSLKALGCESKLHNHGGHFDLSIPSVKWQEVEFPDHASVDKWGKWLKALGFETRHTH